MRGVQDHYHWDRQYFRKHSRRNHNPARKFFQQVEASDMAETIEQIIKARTPEDSSIVPWWFRVRTSLRMTF